MPPGTKAYAEALDFLEFWYHARPYAPKHGGPEEIAVRAALDQQPQLVQCVKRQLKELLRNPTLCHQLLRGVWVVAPDDDAPAWVVRVIRGLSRGQRLRAQTGRVAHTAQFDLPVLGPRRRPTRPRAEERPTLMADDDPVR